MEIIKGHLWSLYAQGYTIIIDTAGDVDGQGRLKMSNNPFNESVVEYLPWFRARVGTHLRKHGNVAVHFIEHRVVTFPIKDTHDGLPSEKLIKKSCLTMNAVLAGYGPAQRPLYMHQPACGPAPLNLWYTLVKPKLELWLPKDIVLVTTRQKARGPKVGV